MSTTESAIKIKEMSEASGRKRLSEDELVEELSESIRKSDMGATKPARAVSKSMREKTIQHFDL
ncbi:hypothetical protein [Roseburia inulinivorans]